MEQDATRRIGWWTVAVVGVSLACAVTLLFLQPEPPRLVAGLVAAVVIAGLWFVLGCRTREGSPAAVTYVIAVVLAIGALCFAHPALAVAQCIVFPIVWTQLDRLPGIVAANVGVALSAGVGSVLGTGFDEGDVIQIAIIEGISLLFSLGFGLWITGIARQSDERQRLLDELHAAQDALASVSRDAGAAAERERFARDIHDTVAQDLTGLVMLAQQARRELGTAAATDTLALLEQSARDALAETRSLVAATASPALDDRGLVPALERLAERFERETGVTVTVTVAGSPLLDRDREVVLLRCAQEGLANVRKHARAHTVQISLLESSHVATLVVTDDGEGFDPAGATSGFGLAGMRERLAIVGGSLDLASGDTGTTLRIGVPA